jgi:hypothetical protein
MMLLDVSVLPKKKIKVQKHFILIRLSLSGEGAIFRLLVVLRKNWERANPTFLLGERMLVSNLGSNNPSPLLT